jgi:AmmeMemoRadiSam system protein A
MSMNEQQRRQLLVLARESIRMRLLDAHELRPTREDFVDGVFWHEQGVFVTLTEDGALRGCIGTIMPVSPLVEAVAENAVSAAFGDPRFEPVEESEFAKLRIEISLLSVPAQLPPASVDDLLAKLSAEQPGVILQYGGHQATFLPQVWEQLPDAAGFLEALCHKAGLHSDCLSQSGMKVFTYTVEAFSEESR